MEDLIKRIRVQFSGLEEESQDEDWRRRQIRPKKAVQFKKESKSADNWFQNQFSGQMNDASDAEFLAAVAAAAYAISLQQEEASESKKKPTHYITSQPLVEESSMNKKLPSEEVKGHMTRIISKNDEDTSKKVDSSRTVRWLTKKGEDTSKPTDSSKISRWLSSKDPNEDEQEESGDNSQIKPAVPKKKMPEEAGVDPKLPEKTMGTTLIGKRTPTFSDKNLNKTGHDKDKKVQTGQQTLSSINPSTSFPVKGNGGSRATHSSKAVAKADQWEATKMIKIQKKYEKMKSTILEWENEKKVKAKRRLERKERQLELRRARALQEYRNEESRVNQIAGGAKALAEERRRDAEARAKDKANKIRSTGKVPRRCLCC